MERGAITLAIIDPTKKKDPTAIKQRVRQLERAMEKANVLIYGLNAMIDYAQKALKVPVRKMRGIKP